MRTLIIILSIIFIVSCFKAPLSLPDKATVKEKDEYIVYELDDELYIYSTEYGLFKKIED